MKINRKPMIAKPRKVGFFEWILTSPKAFAITWRIALITPCVLFGAGIAAALAYHSWLTIPSVLMTLLAFYNLWRNRQWFSTETTNTIGGLAFGIKVEKEAGDPAWVKDTATAAKSDVQFIDDKEDIREVEKK